MSVTLTITGYDSILQTNYFPPLSLDDSDYECGLLYFSTFNSIPNINEKNNSFSYGDKGEINIPPGAYEVDDIFDYLKENISDCNLEIKTNNNTLKCSIICDNLINFHHERSIGCILGFPKLQLEPNKWHESPNNVDILPLSVIRIECDLVQGSYTNGQPSHIIHEFVPNVPPGYRIIEAPANVIYFPINKSNISTVTVKLVDVNGDSIDFRKENIQLCLHIRKIK